MTSIWSLVVASKFEAVKSNLFYESCSTQKILTDFFLKLIKRKLFKFLNCANDK